MKKLNSADGIMALKHSVKKKLVYYVIKKVKLCVGMPQRHMVVQFQSFLNLELCGLEESTSRSVSFILGKRASGLYERLRNFLSGQLGGTDKPLITNGNQNTLYRLPKSHPAHYVDYSRIISTKSQSFCTINSSASLTDLAVLLPKQCEGRCYAVHSSNWRNTQTYAHMTWRNLPTCNISLGQLTLPANEAGEFVVLILLIGIPVTNSISLR